MRLNMALLVAGEIAKVTIEDHSVSEAVKFLKQCIPELGVTSNVAVTFEPISSCILQVTVDLVDPDFITFPDVLIDSCGNEVLQNSMALS